jgi:hypothetical protein
MTAYPLIFGFRDAVSGNGFRAGVAVQGHALVVEESAGDWWVYGVRPAALAGNGGSPNEAYNAFRNAYRGVLFDIAEESPDLASFRAAVTRFFEERDLSEEARWEEAAMTLRAGAPTPDQGFLDLPRVRAESRPATLEVVELDNPAAARPSENEMDRYEVAAA